MPITTYCPGIAVTLTKMVHRRDGDAQRYTGAQRTIDLTQFMGDGTSISTDKTLYRPDGSWSITFVDRPEADTQDTMYALIEPMDIVEIRGSHVAFNYAGGTLPLLMRGFVTSVRRAQTMTPTGPQRSVIVRGSDYGKLWLIHGVWMEVAISQELPLLSTFQMQTVTGMFPQIIGVGQFMQTVTNDVINRKIQEMAAFDSPPVVKQFSCNPTVTEGLITPTAMGTFAPGPFWNWVKAFSDSPWNELFIDDSDLVGPQLVFRPTPFKDINGNWLNGATDPGTIMLDIVDVTALEVGRSDERASNFFWTPPGASMMDTPAAIQAWDIVQGNPFDFNYPNNSPALYGYRKMEWPTALLPNSITSFPRRQADAQQPQNGSDLASWHIQRGQALQAANRDNVVLEDGVIRARGREDFDIGQYLQLTQGQLTSEFYLTRVSHTIEPYGSWQTTLGVERGTGFLARNKMEGSPFWAEGRPGTYGDPLAGQTQASTGQGDSQ